MSWHQWTESCFGYPLFNGHNFGKVLSFITDHINLVISDEDDRSGFLNDISVVTNEQEFFEIAEESMASYVAWIMNKLDGCYDFCGFDSCCNCDTEEHIGFSRSYPWEFSPKYRKQEDAIAALKKFAAELGIEGNPEYNELYYAG